ncbi:MAG: hypothetical protein IVW55_15855 [Chloroflexi bacterium]|nr:hypothetical protein [Chloroflexota bacterium]
MLGTNDMEYLSNGNPDSAGGTGTAPYDTPLPRIVSQPVRSRGSAAPTPAAAPASSVRLVPRGAIELLPQESVAFQLGALYLTNKRVILLAPSVVRAAFLRDIDAVGTVTERASGWSLFFGLLLAALAVLSLYASYNRSTLQSTIPQLYIFDPIIIAGVLGLLAALAIVGYFLWTKRTLFVSVSGRPLITVSITDWNSRKLEGMDAFVNSFFQLKDALHAGEFGD